MNMRFIAAMILVAATCSVSQTAIAGTLLVGFNKFSDEARGRSITKSSADEGVFAASSTITYCLGSTSTGGSVDNWYGPDSAASGGHITNQTPFDGASNGAYLSEAQGGNARSNASYAKTAPTPSMTTAGGGSSSANGRILSLNGTDIFVTNNSNASYRIDTLLFDSFLGGVSNNSQNLSFTKFTFTTFRNDGSMATSNFTVTKSFAGVNMQSGESTNQAMSDPNLVNNMIDFGVGTNYIDYVVDLGGLILRPGDSFSLGFNVIGSGLARGDNFAIIGTHLPEPMTALAFGGLLGLGLLDRRRRRA